MPAIKISSASSVHLDNVGIVNFDVGVQGDPGSSITANQVTFDNVRLPWDLADSAPSSLRGTRISNDPKMRDGAKHGSFKGWRRLNGPPLPVFCPMCKSIFPSKNYNLSGQYFNLWNNEETCHQCGFEHAKLSEGVFDLTSEVIKILRSPDFTYAMVQATELVARDLIENRTSFRDAVTRFNNINPSIGALANKSAILGFTFLNILAVIVTLYGGYRYQVDRNTGYQEAVAEQRERKAVLEALSKLIITLNGVRNNLQGGAGEQPHSVSVKHEVGKAPCVDFKAKGKPKSCNIRKRADRERRDQFGGARHSRSLPRD